MESLFHCLQRNKECFLFAERNPALSSPSIVIAEETPRSLLVKWANAEGHWVRSIVSEVVDTKAELPPERCLYQYELFLREKELAPDETPDVPPIGSGEDEADTTRPLVLNSISGLERVNALASGQTIEFNPKLTVVFGENACGKTGYVRVLKKASAVKTARDILPNVFDAASTPKTPPKATLTYALGTQLQLAVEWKDQKGLAPFTRIDVFDSTIAPLHVDDELSYVHTPGGLARFPFVQRAITAVQALLDEDIKSRKSVGNPLLSRLNRNSKLYAKIESLGAATDLQELERLGEISEEERLSLETLKKEAEALRATNIQDKVRLASDEARFLEKLIRALERLAGFDAAIHDQRAAALETARTSYNEATVRSFAGMELPGVLGEAWAQFIKAGEAYIAEQAVADYPGPADVCVYCRQGLDEAARQLISKYRAYCNGNLRETVTRMERELNIADEPLTGTDLTGIRTEVATRMSAGENHEAIQSAMSALDRAHAAQAAVRVAAAIAWDGFTDQLKASAASAKLRLGEVQTLLQNVTAQAEERQRLLREREAAIIDIEARLLLRSSLPEIRTFVENAKWSDRANRQRGGISQVLRGLTTTTKAASEQLLNQSFEKLFANECRRLRAPAVRLAFPGKEGKVVRTKAVARDYKPSETLSEGEQKVIALADFLAEVELKKPAAPVVFDDPINSLDHIRLAEVVDRIAELAGARQVIVFTHNIFFLNSLLSKFDHTPNDYTCYQVETIDGTPGIVTRGAGPRRDSLKYLITKIEDNIQTATGSTGETRMSAIETGYSYLRNLCEVVAERELLQGVAERYRPNVMVSGLVKLNFAKLPLVAPRLDAVHSKCHRIIQAHSQPLATLGVRPTLDELKADLAEVKAIRKDCM